MLELRVDGMEALVLEVALRRYEKDMRSFLSDGERLKVSFLLNKVNKLIKDELTRS